MGIRAAVVLVVLWVSTDVAVAGRWVVGPSDQCVHEWTPGSMVRGPLAMTNALTFPGRQLVGGAQAVSEDPAPWTGARVLLVPTMAVLGLGTGTAECLFVLGMGMADFLTAGAFDLVSDASADPSLAPMKPPFLVGLKQPETTDPCGRPL